MFRKSNGHSSHLCTVGLLAMASIGSSSALGQAAPPVKPRIAVFSGPTATVQHGEPLVTSNKARAKYGLPLMKDDDGQPLRFDAVRPQRLAAPVTVYVEAFSAHPLEKDMAALYAAPDGYLNPQTHVFNKQKLAPTDVPVYEVTLDPSDGLYMLPYMARQADGSAWEGDCTANGAQPANEKCRGGFYPDASRPFEEIDRFGLGGPFAVDQLSTKANFDFYRAAPAAGYRNGQPAAERTDVGTGDIPKEVWGRDFYPYGDGLQMDPSMHRLAYMTNMVQHAMSSGKYVGGIWLEGSPTNEESSYWLDLLIDTPWPLSDNSSQSPHQALGNDGDKNIIDSVKYILSGIWKDDSGKDKIGVVMTQESRIITAREVQKTDARPGGYLPTGGHGGFVASVNPLVLTFIPNRKHTWTSDVNTTRLPASVPGVHQTGSQIVNTTVAIKDSNGDILESAIPMVTIAKYASYSTPSYPPDTSEEVEVAARIDKNLKSFPLSGIVLEGSTPYGHANPSLIKALDRAALRGMPVVHVGRGNNEGFTTGGFPALDNLEVNGSDLTSTKARLLLMACIMKLGALPVPANPDNPTKEELTAIVAKLKQYQAIFDTH